MTKSLSEQLCKICGIKPKIIQDNEDYHIEALPDFTKPENFVKLLKVLYRFILRIFLKCKCFQCTPIYI